MHNYVYDWIHMPGRLLIGSILAASLSLSSCDQRPGQIPQEPDPGLGRTGASPLFHVSYEVETFSHNSVKGGNENSKELVFRRISTLPLLERKSVDFQVFEDGSYNMTTIPLMPKNPERMTETQRKLLASSPFHKSVISNGMVRYYDKDGNEAGKYTLKAFPFKSIVEQLTKERPTRAVAEEIGARIAGRPSIDKASILENAKQYQAEVIEESSFTKIRYDMEKLAAALNGDPTAYAGKISEQFYDFKNGRLLGSNIYHKGKLVSRSVLIYAPVDQGNQVVKTVTEDFETDSKTGAEIKRFRQENFSDMKVEVNF